MKRTDLLTVFLITLVMLFASAVGLGDDKVSLKLNLSKGKTYLVKTNTESNITRKEQKKEQKMKQITGIDMSYLVQDVDAAGVATVKITFTATRFKMITSFGVIEYDSQNTKGKPPLPARSFSAMIGQSLTIKWMPDGKISSIDGADALLNKIVKAINMKNIEPMIKQQFGEEQLTEMFEGAMGVYPEDPIGPGDAWEQRTVLSRGYPVILNNTYKLKERKDGVLTIDVTGAATPNTSASPVDLGIAKIQYTVSGTQEGLIKIKEATGMVVSSRTVQNLSGQVESIPGKKGGKSVSAPITIDSVTTSEVTEGI